MDKDKFTALENAFDALLDVHALSDVLYALAAACERRALATRNNGATDNAAAWLVASKSLTVLANLTDI